MAEIASLVLFSGNLEQTAAFYRTVGFQLNDEDHGDGPRHLAGHGAPVLTAHEARPWGCRAVVEDPDGRAVEINQRSHCASQ